MQLNFKDFKGVPVLDNLTLIMLKTERVVVREMPFIFYLL